MNRGQRRTMPSFCGTLSLACLAFATFARAQVLTAAQLSAVKSNLMQGAKQSWELGTETEALTEFDSPHYSVVKGAVPPPPGPGPASLDEVFAIAKNIVSNLTISPSDPNAPQPLDLPPGMAAGDSASLGFAVLLADWTGRGKVDGLDYGAAATAQVDWTLTDVPRTPDGAISHRIEQVQLWADSVYMVPPTLAYYGAMNNNRSLLEEAHNQIRLYRQYLRDPSAGGLWKHILLGEASQDDEGHWSTGNAWAAAGMIRVMATIQHSKFSREMTSEVQDLISWVSEIHDGVYPHLNSDGLFNNYADNSSTFHDAAGTAMLASTVYRLSLLAGVHTHIPLAEFSRKSISAPLNSAVSSHASPTSTGAAAPVQSLLHFDNEMWLTPVPNPDNWSVLGEHSPESQAFVIEMYAAWRDWVAAGSPGAHGI
ncbi:glycoside hydrolase family 105 protein [Gelatoporia subvermispora B]|uniref:Glycoside hydrolase family 105 protein n=1 Tax=Ceriporiopsis subvermispora (strain B) TaxID=914234 RepID=M2QYS7_CERS8|nr:glycoside hydrolase family 105 protein [Gelatoporia subvermispora B]